SILSGSKETAETQVLVGMGMLAGSAIILLTLLWGSCVAVGKTDIDGSTTIDKQDTKGFSSTGFSTMDAAEKTGICDT
ncbi:Sodium/calcium exchanger NCL2, partial [Thalictrum thalictroides]